MAESKIAKVYAMGANQEKPTVLVVENSVDITGAFNAIFHYANYARSSYNFVFILPCRSRLTKQVSDKGFPVETLPFLEISKRPINLFLYLPVLIKNAVRLKRLIQRHRVSLVHVNDFYNLTAVVAKMLGGRFALLTHVRFMPDRFPQLLVKCWMYLNLRYSEHIICVSYAVKRCLPTHSKVQVVYDGLAYTVPNKINREKSNHDCINLLYLAHYISGKGQNYALKAFCKAYEQNSKLRLRFVGGDMGLKKNQLYREQLVRRTEELGIQEVVTFAGPTSNISQEFAQADIALNFSESESFSMTCLEALAHGVPLIATDCGGPAELFEHGKSGYLVQNRNEDAMTEAILKLADDNLLREHFKNNGQTYIRSKFLSKNALKKLEQLYQDIVPC